MSEKPYRGSRSLADIGLDSLQRAAVLEWFADKLWVAQEEGSRNRDYGGKSYDPLSIELRPDGGGIAHSYVFNLRDGGRHHSFDSLNSLEEMLVDEAIGVVRWAVGWGAEAEMVDE